MKDKLISNTTWKVILYTAIILGIWFIYKPYSNDLQQPTSNSTFVYQNF